MILDYILAGFTNEMNKLAYLDSGVPTFALGDFPANTDKKERATLFKDTKNREIRIRNNDNKVEVKGGSAEPGFMA